MTVEEFIRHWCSVNSIRVYARKSTQWERLTEIGWVDAKGRQWMVFYYARLDEYLNTDKQKEDLREALYSLVFSDDSQRNHTPPPLPLIHPAHDMSSQVPPK